MEGPRDSTPPLAPRLLFRGPAEDRVVGQGRQEPGVDLARPPQHVPLDQPLQLTAPLLPKRPLLGGGLTISRPKGHVGDTSAGGPLCRCFVHSLLCALREKGGAPGAGEIPPPANHQIGGSALASMCLTTGRRAANAPPDSPLDGEGKEAAEGRKRAQQTRADKVEQRIELGPERAYSIGEGLSMGQGAAAIVICSHVVLDGGAREQQRPAAAQCHQAIDRLVAGGSLQPAASSSGGHMGSPRAPSLAGSVRPRTRCSSSSHRDRQPGSTRYGRQPRAICIVLERARA